jgi:CheY-like chemotaxis protein
MDTILLVDDNPLRASMRKSLLESSSPEVIRVMDASEALCVVETPELAQNLALVVTGHVMSGITGPEFVAEIRNRMPEVPVLVLSAVPGAEEEYVGIPGVAISETRSPEELRGLVNLLLTAAQPKSA